MLFNKDTFYPDIEVKSSNLHDTRHELPDKVMEGDLGWVLQGVLSRASFRRRSLSGQKTFTVLSVHINNIYAKKRGIAKKLILTIRAVMLGEHVDLVAGDFNGTAWRCSNRNNISTIEEAFADCALPTPPGPTPLWDTRFDSRMLGRRARVPEVRQLLESPTSRRFLHPTQNSRPAPNRSKLPPRDMASPRLR